MAHLNVYVTGAPPEKSVRVDASAAAAHDWAEVGIVFPAFRLTDPHGVINFIHTDTPLTKPLSVVFACEKAVSEVVHFDGTHDVDVSLAYAPFKSGVGPIPVLPRPPLPQPFPDPVRDAQVWSTVLPWDAAGAPAPTSRDYLRGDAWGVVMPDAPLIDGANAATKDQILSWFLDRYPIEFQREYLLKYAGYGYTHFYLSPPDSIDGYGRSLAEFVETCQLVKSYGLYVGVMLSSKYFQKQDMTLDEYIAYVDPLLEALLPVADEFVPFWEGNLYNIPGETHVNIARYVGQHAHAAGKSAWLHFSPHVTSWFADGDPRGRFGFWDDMHGDINGLNYQSLPEWTTQELCDRLVDTLWQFGEGGNLYKLRMWEDKATQQYHGDATPDDGDARGFLTCCTYDNVKHTDAKIWGFGNGGRRADGSRI